MIAQSPPTYQKFNILLVWVASYDICQLFDEHKNPGLCSIFIHQHQTGINSPP